MRKTFLMMNRDVCYVCPSLDLASKINKVNKAYIFEFAPNDETLHGAELNYEFLNDPDYMDQVQDFPADFMNFPHINFNISNTHYKIYQAKNKFGKISDLQRKCDVWKKIDQSAREQFCLKGKVEFQEG